MRNLLKNPDGSYRALSIFGPPPWYVLPQEAKVEPKALSVREAGIALGVGYTTAKSLVKSGELRSYVVRTRRMVSREAVDSFISKREGKRK